MGSQTTEGFTAYLYLIDSTAERLRGRATATLSACLINCVCCHNNYNCICYDFLSLPWFQFQLVVDLFSSHTYSSRPGQDLPLAHDKWTYELALTSVSVRCLSVAFLPPKVSLLSIIFMCLSSIWLTCPAYAEPATVRSCDWSTFLPQLRLPPRHVWVLVYGQTTFVCRLLWSVSEWFLWASIQKLLT